jgi:hypothetical protein
VDLDGNASRSARTRGRCAVQPLRGAVRVVRGAAGWSDAPTAGGDVDHILPNRVNPSGMERILASVELVASIDATNSDKSDRDEWWYVERILRNVEIDIGGRRRRRLGRVRSRGYAVGTAQSQAYPRSMSIAEWHPLSQRLDGLPATAWRREVPAALVKPLRKWVDETLRGCPPLLYIDERGIAERVLLRLDLVSTDVDVQEGEGSDGETAARGFLAYGTPVDLLPDVVDAALYLLPTGFNVPVDMSVQSPTAAAIMTSWAKSIARDAVDWANARRGVLSELLDDALSVLRVDPDGVGLERRADASASSAFGEAVRSAEAASGTGSAAGQLREAWGCVHALRPDPVKAYAQAIKAVESAAHALVEPRNAKATLGTMLGHLRTNRSRFSLVIPGPNGNGDVDPLIACMTLLWDGQSSRHGSSSPTRDETLEEATMAVHLAVTLVQWFTSGAVRRSAAA